MDLTVTLLPMLLRVLVWPELCTSLVGRWIFSSLLVEELMQRGQSFFLLLLRITYTAASGRRRTAHIDGLIGSLVSLFFVFIILVVIGVKILKERQFLL